VAAADTPPEPWQLLADTLLQRQALICRLGDGVVPHDFAGLYVDDAEIDRVLRTLPGLAAPPDGRAALEARLAPALHAARSAFRASLELDGPLARLVRAARLDPADAELLALLAAVETAPHRARLVAYVQDNVQLPRLTLATLARMGFAPPGPGSALRRCALVDVTGDGPWATWMCSAAARVVWALHGDDTADPALPPGARHFPAPRAAPPPAATLFLVSGADRVSRRRAVHRAHPGQPLLVSPVPADASQWAALVREAAVTGAVAVLECDRLEAAVADRIDRADRVSWAISSDREVALEALPDRPRTEVRVEDGFADAADWAAALGVPPDPAFRLTRSQLELVATTCGGDPAGLPSAVRRLAGGHLDGLATRVRPSRGWHDLVLPADQTRRLHELVARQRGRSTVYGRWGFSPRPSTGVVALFAGPSGTGKTLAAEVVAGALGLDLYKIDLSSVVSKYIGETEKNLERIFGAAAAGDLVLFFDEADALFGKRSDVGDAHDRYANIEVAYLLQRLETYDGIVILATNLQRNIDQAFTRRISVGVEFDEPDEEYRRVIWQRCLPATAPVDALDLDFLARQFEVTGGTIRNAVLAAAFLAADEAGPITMERVIRALQREFQKQGRLRTASEFDRYFDLVGDDHAAPAR
jgi:hypothetical protein